MRKWLEWTGLGLQMLTFIIIGIVGGIWLDEQVGNKENPWFTIVCALLGSVAAIVHVTIAVLRNYNKPD